MYAGFFAWRAAVGNESHIPRSEVIRRRQSGLSLRVTDSNRETESMGNKVVTLKVTPFVRIDCKFWLTDDGWNGSCEQPFITVQAGSFEHAKSEMEIALGKYVESRMREPQRTNTGQAA
jgi:hypothetical protein